MFQIEYRSEIQFLSCFIWHLVNPIETEIKPETEMGQFMFGCSLFVRFSASTVGLEPSEKRLQPAPLSVSGQHANASNRNQWIYKMSK